MNVEDRLRQLRIEAETSSARISAGILEKAHRKMARLLLFMLLTTAGVAALMAFVITLPNSPRVGEPPGATATTIPAANAAGWNNQAVRVDFDCDARYFKTCPADIQLKKEGIFRLTKAQRTAIRLNGQAFVIKDVEEIKIDMTAPDMKPFKTSPLPRGHWNTSAVSVFWRCDDTLSGPLELLSQRQVDGEGKITKYETCLDKAGNKSKPSPVEVWIDRQPPQIKYLGQNPRANGFGWNRTSVTLTWACIDATSQPKQQTVNDTVDTPGESSPGFATCEDNAGHSTVGTRSVRIDKQAPSTSIGDSAVISVNGVDMLRGSSSDQLSGIAETVVTFTDKFGNRSVRKVVCKSDCRTTTWSVPLPPCLGTHAINAYSIDRAGNIERTKVFPARRALGAGHLSCTDRAIKLNRVLGLEPPHLSIPQVTNLLGSVLKP